jgi:hypothetical protein
MLVLQLSMTQVPPKFVYAVCVVLSFIKNRETIEDSRWPSHQKDGRHASS